MKKQIQRLVMMAVAFLTSPVRHYKCRTAIGCFANR
jgi:hypothetical protein